MDFIRQQWTLIQERLAGLNASQKMLVAALVAITVMTLLYWGKYASSREMVALNSVPMSAEEITAATQSLRAKGINFTTSGSTIMVPADDQMVALSDLSFNQVLPAAPNFFESMFEKQSTFGTAGDYKARLNNARERTLSAMILGFPDVKNAIVLINDPQQSGIGRFEPRATVNVVTKSGTGVKRLAQASSMLVLNAVSGLKRENISVMVDGQSIRSPSDSGGTGDEARDLILAWEKDVSDKIRGQLSFIPSILVSVTAEVDTQTRKEVIHKVDPTNKIIAPTKTDTETTTTNEPAASFEPGVIANAGVDATATGAPMAGSSTEKSVEENQVDYGKSQIEISTPAGKARIIGEALRVPRSHFVNVWRVANNKLDGEPNEAEYVAVFDKSIAAMRTEVQGLTGIAEAQKITVNEFPDLDGLASLMNPGKGENSLSGVSFIAGNYAKEGAIGVLALASLFMVSRIVKKSVPAAPIALGGAGMSMSGAGTIGSGSSGKSRGSVTLGGDELIAGEVAEGGTVLMGRELDPAMLETAQMVEQVSNYVKENPDTAAALIRRLVAAG